MGIQDGRSLDWGNSRPGFSAAGVETPQGGVMRPGTPRRPGPAGASKCRISEIQQWIYALAESLSQLLVGQDPLPRGGRAAWD